MTYEIFLAPRAKKQYENFDRHIRDEIRSQLLSLEHEPYDKGNIIKGHKSELRYIKIAHTGVQYRAVFDIERDKNEVSIVFVGSRENFYKELRRFMN